MGRPNSPGGAGETSAGDAIVSGFAFSLGRAGLHHAAVQRRWGGERDGGVAERCITMNTSMFAPPCYLLGCESLEYDTPFLQQTWTERFTYAIV